MPNSVLIKVQGGLAPGDPQTEEFVSKVKLGGAVRGNLTIMQPRNAAFHRKFFALLNLAYEYWEPPETDTKWGKPVKNFENFRKNLTVLAGHGQMVFNIDGTFKMQADSISFGSMDQTTFDALYQNMISVVIKNISAMEKWGEDKINDVVNKVLEFA